MVLTCYHEGGLYYSRFRSPLVCSAYQYVLQFQYLDLFRYCTYTAETPEPLTLLTENKDQLKSQTNTHV